MATAQAYFSSMVGNLNDPHATIAQLVAQLGGRINPNKDDYRAAAKIDVTDPELRTIAQYLADTGAQGYVYDRDQIKSILDDATTAAHQVQQGELDQSNAMFNRNMATAQDTAMDTIRSQNAQAIQAGINKGMQNANMLSTIIGTSQSAAEQAQKNAEARVNAANQYYADLAANGKEALTQSTNNYNTLLGNIRQLYNDDIQQKTADLEYNASLEETLANYLASKYNADTNYSNNVNTVAGGIYNNNQSVLGGMINAAIAAEAQDNYTDAYGAAQAAQLAAQQAAQKQYASKVSSTTKQLASQTPAGTTSSAKSAAQKVNDTYKAQANTDQHYVYSGTVDSHAKRQGNSVVPSSMKNQIKKK